MAKRRTVTTDDAASIFNLLKKHYKDSGEEDPKTGKNFHNYDQPMGPDPLAIEASKLLGKDVSPSSITRIANSFFGPTKHSNKSLAKYYQDIVAMRDLTILDLEAELRFLKDGQSRSNIHTASVRG